jgi:hypothetical protein
MASLRAQRYLRPAVRHGLLIPWRIRTFVDLPSATKVMQLVRPHREARTPSDRNPLTISSDSCCAAG